MIASFLTVFTALASIQVLLVVKLADFLTEGTESRGTRTVDAAVRHAGIA